MRRELLRAKVHGIKVTERNVDYEGSLTLDRDLMDAVGLLVYERIDVWNVTNGNRFSTYLIEGGRGSGACCVNGAAAHLVEAGDKVIIAAYASLDESELAGHRPQVIFIGDGNRIKHRGESERAFTHAPS